MIVDCFPFFDELDLLEIRLHELKDVVDVFILTESPFTFTGIEKPLHFAENKARFKEFNIVHTVYEPKGTYEPIIFEKHQKQYGIDHYFDICSSGDILMQGDVDEIPKASVLQEVIKDDWKSAKLGMTLYYYYLNCRGITKKREHNTRLLRTTEWYEYDAGQKKDKQDVGYPDAGWHFSFLGDVAAKLEAWGHADQYNKPPYNKPKHIEKCKKRGVDIFMRKGRYKVTFEFVEDLNYLPHHVLANLDRFGKYIRIDFV